MAIISTNIFLNDLEPSNYFDMVTPCDDSDVEVPIAGYASLADTTLNTGDIVSRSTPALLKLISSINAHFNRINFSGGYDQYLINNNLRVSNYFNQLYAATFGNYLLAKNVFCDTDSLFGTINLTSGPSISFVDSINFGNGSIPYRLAKDGNFAATQLKIKVVNFGGTRCDLNIIGTDKDNNIISNAVSIPAVTNEGDYVSIGSSSNRYLDVGSITFANSNHGTNGDVFEIRNIPERVI